MADNRSSASDPALSSKADVLPARKPLSAAAQRALAEAAERRAWAEAERPTARAVEHQGPQGPEPTRFGDWERKGIASDF